jgi:predicted adenine nucleotide alpha hydrolase (AANH) superfamily ATPase
MRLYAEHVSLPVIWWEGFEMPAYLATIAGHETLGERCVLCYRMRLKRTAQMAQERGFDAFTTTLLISPYQKQDLIRSIGEELAQGCSVEFYFENLRKGWSQRGRMAREHNLYLQRYCGCLYSKREANKQRASIQNSESSENSPARAAPCESAQVPPTECTQGASPASSSTLSNRPI